MRIIPSKPEAFDLMMRGSAAFTDMECNGMRIDVEYLDRVINDTETEIEEREHQLRQDAVYKAWEKKYGRSADLGKREQLADILFNELAIECKEYTKSGKPKTDTETLETIDVPFVQEWNSLEKLKKFRSTSLIGIRKEVDDGFLRPSFCLNFAKTYRSSVRSPNSQNIPTRDKVLGKLIRSAFIPRSPDYCLLEVDYGALEFRGAACFWRDDEMVAYASNPELDIHRDMASDCYMLDLDQVSKKARSHAKNSFVFPVLYGSWYKNCSKNLWAQIGRQGIETPDGVGLYDHLREKGISSLDSFEQHIKDVERRFNERFSHWSQAKEQWWSDYTKHAAFPLMTGFVCRGVFSRNFLMNAPIQGPSFHLLLSSLIELNDWLKKNRMWSRIIGQIHDSIIFDLHKDERDYVIPRIKWTMTQYVRKVWDWVIVPLEIEAELSETNWFGKTEIEI